MDVHTKVSILNESAKYGTWLYFSRDINYCFILTWLEKVHIQGEKKKTTLLWVTKPYYMIVFGLHHNHKKKKRKGKQASKKFIITWERENTLWLRLFRIPLNNAGNHIESLHNIRWLKTRAICSKICLDWEIKEI